MHSPRLSQDMSSVTDQSTLVYEFDAILAALAKFPTRELSHILMIIADVIPRRMLALTGLNLHRSLQ
jgi:hypothetical protein